MPAPMNASDVSVFILTKNEEEKIEAALRSVLWAQEIVVIDSFSDDRTVEIARSYGAEVVQIPFSGFGLLRQAGIEHTRYPWIFSLDSDERCSDAVRNEILRITRNPRPAAACRNSSAAAA